MTTPRNPLHRWPSSLSGLNVSRLHLALGVAAMLSGAALPGGLARAATTGGAGAPPPATTASQAAPKATTPTATGLLLHYKFDQKTGTKVPDASGRGNDGVLEGGAAWTTAGRVGGAVDLNGTTGFVRLPAGLLAGQRDVTIAAWVHADALSTWARVFDFGSGTDNWMFLTLNDFTGATRFAVSPKGGSENLLTGPGFPGTGAWHHVAVVMSGNTYTLYVDGLPVSSVSNMQNTPAKLGATTQNFIGKSQFAPDPFFDGKIDDFRIYGRALPGTEVVDLVTAGMTDKQRVAYAKAWLNLGDTSQVTGNLRLPTSGPGGAAITWQSSNPAVVGAAGQVTRPAAGQPDQTVTLTATLRRGTAQDTQTFKVNVWATGAKAYTLDVQADQPLHPVSPTLYGIFFEDINYAADGGLYAELVQNRSFEFDTPLAAWTPVTPAGAGKSRSRPTNP